MKVKLQHVAHARSGDKGNTANIEVFAYAPELYPPLKEQLTAARVKAFYQGVITGTVERYAIDSLGALNFVAHGALGGGVSRSLCLDNYGKALSAALSPAGARPMKRFLLCSAAALVFASGAA